MKILLENIGKRFNKEWIFRNINFEFSGANKYSILGTNGSGKSTLLQIIAGSLSQSEGKIKWQNANGMLIMSELFFKNISFAAPYIELPEEMTWRECISFQHKFMPFISSMKTDDIISISGLQSSAGKEIRNFSSGMKQRAKLSLAILADTPLLLLDEPATNLDENSVKWYQHLIEKYSKEKMMIVCSNYNMEEYSLCESSLKLS
jgi:ABC-type multidrug transport system ATPase subunit